MAPPKVIYVVDDEASALRAAVAVLRRPGWSLRTFASPMEALDGLEQLTPDLVVADLDMPWMGGVRFIEEIRRRVPSARTILCAGGEVPPEAREALERGDADALCAKPYAGGLLPAMARQLLGEPAEDLLALAG